MKTTKDPITRWQQNLPDLKIQAPANFTESVMKQLPQTAKARQPRQAFFWSWPQGQWFAPALAGAVLAMLMVGGLQLLHTGKTSVDQNGSLVRISFEFHAPDARSVSLAGSFNGWTPGEIKLTGPDRTGLWHTEISLPEGVHEYGFFVNESEWVSDPKALAYQEDGFGSRNSLVTL